MSKTIPFAKGISDTMRPDFHTVPHALNTEARCVRYIERVRWPDGMVCVECGQDTVRRVSVSTRGKVRRLYYCRVCMYAFAITSGTFMAGSHLPLLTWFRAITAIWKKPELSIKELQRQIGITYKTAWAINYRIRKAIRGCDGNPEKLF
jgi:transposase-like protein